MHFTPLSLCPNANYLLVQALRVGDQPGCWQILRENCRCLQGSSMPGWVLITSSSPRAVSAAHAGDYLQLLCRLQLPAALTLDQQSCQTSWLPKLPLDIAQTQSWQLPMSVAPLSLKTKCQGHLKEGNIRRKLPLGSRLKAC